MVRKRRISDLTKEDTDRLLLALVGLQESLDETDEDLPPELLPALRKLATKLQAVPHVPFSRVDQVVFNQLGIQLKPLVLRVEKRTEIETLGLVGPEGNWLTIDVTKQLLCLIRSHVSRVNEAGSRILINVFLLRLASVMRNEKTDVNIIPEFPISRATLQGHCFSGVVDFLVTQAHSKYTDLLLDTPVAALGSYGRAENIASNIFVAKRDNVRVTFPQAVVATALYCKEHQLSVMRGCITSGEQWAFFVYRTGVLDEGEVALAREIALGRDLEELPLLLGLLRDWVENAKDYEQKFFEIQ